MTTRGEAHTSMLSNDLRHKPGEGATVKGCLRLLFAIRLWNRTILIVMTVVKGIHLLLREFEPCLIKEELLYLIVRYRVDCFSKAVCRHFEPCQLSKKLVLGESIIPFTRLSSDANATVTMIRSNHHRGVAIFLRELEGSPHGAVKRKEVRVETHRVVGMRRPVYFTAFHHQKEPFVIGRELLYSRSRHLFNRGLF